MDREGFRNRLKQYKEARGLNPLLKYWEWKLKYDSAPQPDKMPGQPQSDLPTPSSQHLDNRSHRWDNGYSNVNRDPFDSPYDDARYYDYRKPRFELRKGDVHYSNPNVLKWMGRFGKVLRGGSSLGEVVQNLFPSEEAELIEDLRVKIDKQNKLLTGQEEIPMYDEGTDGVRDNTYVAPIEKELVFIPATGATKLKLDVLRNLTRNGQIKSGAIDIVSPEFDLLTLGRSIGNAIYKNLPTDMVYRRTTQSEIDDIIESGVFRKLPEGKVAGKGKTFTINGKTVTLHKKGGNAHGGKAFSKGEPWRGTTVTGTADETIVGVPGKGTYWKVGHHGDYSDHIPFENIEKGKGLWEPFNENGIVENVSTKGMRVFRPFTYGYKEDGLLPITGLNLIGENVDSYADGGEVTGPPTYEDWLKSLIKNDLWMHPDYYMTYSLNSAADALRLASAGLPGREATPPIPAPVEVKGEFPQEWAMNNLYSVENPKKKGVTKKYAKMYDSRTLGAGVDVVSGHPELYNKAKRFGIEKELADKIAYEHIVHDDLVIRDNYADIYGKAAADTLSFGPRFLVAQARYQLGNVRKGWDEIHNALAKGDAEALKKAVLKVTPEDHNYRKKWVKNFNVYGNEPE